MFVSGMDEQRVSPIVTIDNHQIGRRLATNHLLASGARHNGIITGPLSWWEARQHLEGWDVELRAHGLNANNQIVVEGDWNAESGERGLYRLLDPAHSSWK